LLGESWTPELLDRALEMDQGRALLSIVVERLGDLFEPSHCETYVRLFTQVIARVWPGPFAEEAEAHYHRILEPHAPPASVDRVYVLSRVTLGADVAVTSVMLDAAKRRYPDAQVTFVGHRRNFELFESDARISHLATPYARTAALEDRLNASLETAKLLMAHRAGTRSIVIDPDSRLSQLGLIPICEDEDYFFFESRAYGGAGNESLSALAARWAKQILGVEGARPLVAPLAASGEPADITVSLGVGENPAKRVGGDFERDLLRLLEKTGASVLIDMGGSDEERQRVESVILPGMRSHHGPFAPFAAQIARSRLFIGYDSAAGHVASARGVPLVSIFNGFVSERMFERWRPSGTVIRGDDPELLASVERAVKAALSGSH